MATVRSPRWEVAFDCWFSAVEKDSDQLPDDGRLLELSSRGAFVAASQSPQCGAALDLAFVAPGDPREYRFQVEVVHSGWFEIGGEIVQGFGVGFVEIPAETGRRLRSLLDTVVSRNCKFAPDKKAVRPPGQASDALRNQMDARYKSFFEDAAQAMIMTDAEGRILHCNRAAGRLLGLSAENGGEEGGDLLFSDHLERHRIFEMLSRDGSLSDLKTVLPSADDTLIECSVSGTLRRGADSRPVAAHWIVVDRRRQEHILHLKRRYQTISAIGKFSRAIALELDDRLSAVLALAEGGRDRLQQGLTDSPTIAEHLGKVVDSTHLVMDLTRKMNLLFQRTRVRLQDHNPNTLIRDIVSSWSESETEDESQVVGRFESRSRIQCDAPLLTEALNALIHNARKAVGSGGSIELATRDESLEDDRLGDCSLIPAGDWVRLSVRDSGEELEARSAGDVFLPFHDEKETESGLRLPMVWGITASHCGFVEVTSNGSGNRFHLYLPLFPAQA